MRDYLTGIVAACMIAVLAGALTGKNKPIVRLVSGLMVLIVTAAPLLKLSTGRLERLFSDLRVEGYSPEETETRRRALLKEQIEHSAELYIEQQADALGFQITARVTATSEEYPKPEHVLLLGSCNGELLRQLREKIVQDLGVSEKEVEWKRYET